MSQSAHTSVRLGSVHGMSGLAPAALKVTVKSSASSLAGSVIRSANACSSCSTAASVALGAADGART